MRFRLEEDVMTRGLTARVPWFFVLIAVLTTSLVHAQPKRRGRPRNPQPDTTQPATNPTQTGTQTGTQTTQPAAQTAASSDVCSDAAHVQAATACPAGIRLTGSGATSGLPTGIRAAQEAQAQAQKNGGNKQAAHPEATIDPNIWRRHSQGVRRALDLLRREVQLTATLARQTPQRDPHRPDVLMRLAENLQELSSTANGLSQDLEEPKFQARQAHRDQDVANAERQQQELNREAQGARTQLIQAFEVLARDHPDYNRMDEVYFYLAFAYQDSGDQGSARRWYQQLIQRFPQSRFIPNAYLSFAEFFFESGEMPGAQQMYNQVLAIDTPENQVFGYALYKLAWVYFNLQDFENALNTFVRVIDYAKAHPDNPSVAPLLRTARNELVTAYGSVYGVSRPLNVSTALQFFTRYAADEANAVEMFEKLGELYQDNGQWANSIAIYHELISRSPNSDRVCYWQSQIAKAVVASGRPENQMREVERLVELFTTYRAPNSTRSQEARNSCRDGTARVVFDLASHWHLQAIGRDASGNAQTVGTRDARIMGNAARLYDLLYERFPDLDEVTFPEYQRADWPTRYKIAYYRADLLRDSAAGNPQANCECGPAYDRVVEINPQGEFTEDASYKAVLCYNECFTQQLAEASRQRPTRPVSSSASSSASQTPAADVTPRDLNPQETGMVRAFTRYICFVSNLTPEQLAANRQASLGAGQPQSGQPSDPADDPKTILLTVKYRRAYMYYAAHRFEEAAALFREVAMSDPTVLDPENLREIAADLYMDSLNVMGSMWSPPRSGCYSTLNGEIPTLQGRFCDANGRASHGEFCGRLDLLACQILRKQAESLHTNRRFAEAGRAYISILRNHRECLALETALKADEILYNAAIDFDAANMLGRAMLVRQRLVDRYLDRNSPWAQRALFRLAGNFHAIQVFGRASEYYERYAAYVTGHRNEAVTNDPNAIAQAADALRQATLFRIGLGEEQKALDNARDFARYFGADPDAARRRQAASVVFAIGQIFQDRAVRLARQRGGTPEERTRRQGQIRDAWREVVRHYTSYVNRYASNGTLDQQIQGRVALGRGYWNLEDQQNAQLYFRAAVAGWDPAALQSQRPQQGQGGNSGADDEGTQQSASNEAPGETRIKTELRDQAPEVIEAAVRTTKDAVAEARFYLADVVYRRFAASHLPTFRGGNEAAFRRWETGVLQPFVQRQKTALEQEATPLFVGVMQMRVPNWEVAATARLGDMFYSFANTIREAPIPPDIARNPDLKDAYVVSRDNITQPLVDIATNGFQRCIRRSTRVHWFNEWSQRCEVGLNAIDRRRFPLADEMRGDPHLIYTHATNSLPFYQIASSGDEDVESSEAASAASSGNTQGDQPQGTPPGTPSQTPPTTPPRGRGH